VDFRTGGKSNKKSHRKLTAINLLNDVTFVSLLNETIFSELNLGHDKWIEFGTWHLTISKFTQRRKL